MRAETTRRLLAVVFLEGYVVLAAELLAIRLLVPFVGSGTEIVSIIISAVLLPLALGYHSGGTARERLRAKVAQYPKRTQPRTLRQLLLRNALTSLLILGMGLSYVVLEGIFAALDLVGIENRLLLTTIYATIFLAPPTYLLGQTVPIVSHYFMHARSEKITSRMLFFSTTGSLLGSIFSTLILMAWLGVHWTAAITCALLALLMLILARRWWDVDGIFALIFLAIPVALNSPAALEPFKIISANAYNTAALREDEQGIHLILNRSASSGLSKDTQAPYVYAQRLEDLLLKPLPAEAAPKRILVLGAGGFTFGLKDKKNEYTFVDIDPDLKAVAEKHFLPEALSDNKKFVPVSARAFLNNAPKEYYDIIVIDAYTNVMTIPTEMVTREFMLAVKNVLAPHGVLVSNAIGTANFTDKFTVRYTNSFASVFPVFSREVLDSKIPNKLDTQNAWERAENNRKEDLKNILLIYYNTPAAQDRTIYFDLKNTASTDN